LPTLQQSIVALQFPTADGAAAPAGAAAPPVGVPDIVDFAAVQMPFTGTIVGCSITGAPAAGDTVSVVPQVCTSNAGAITAASLTATITSAAPAAGAIVTKDQADAQFIAGQYIAVRYTTTTGSAYTPRDFAVTLYVSTGRTDI